MKTDVCDNCGQEVEVWTMTEVNIGRRVVKLCSECYQHGSDTARHYTIDLHRRRRKEQEQ